MKDKKRSAPRDRKAGDAPGLAATAAPSAIRIATTRFGEIELPADSVIEFPRGLIGFPRHRRFVVIDRPERGPLRWLQSVDDPALAFVIAAPAAIVADYAIDVPAEDLARLEVRTAADLEVFVILVIPADLEQTTANLLAPLVVGSRRRIGMQVVLESSGYSARHAVFAAPDEDLPREEELETSGGRVC